MMKLHAEGERTLTNRNRIHKIAVQFLKKIFKKTVIKMRTEILQILRELPGYPQSLTNLSFKLMTRNCATKMVTKMWSPI